MSSVFLKVSQHVQRLFKCVKKMGIVVFYTVSGINQGEIDQICYTPRYLGDIVFIISRKHCVISSKLHHRIHQNDIFYIFIEIKSTSSLNVLQIINYFKKSIIKNTLHYNF